MRLHLFTSVGFALLSVSLASGCAGGQTGDLSGEHPGNGGLDTAGGCDEHKEKLAGFDEMTDQGTAEELLAYAEKTFDAPVTWKVDSDGTGWTVGPESGQGRLHLSVTRGANAYRLTYSQPQNSNGVDDLLGSICPPPALGVDAHVTVTTDGGALAESFDTLLRSSTAGVATLDASLDLAKLGGALAVSFAHANAKLVQPSLDATLTAAGSTGKLSGIDQTQFGTGKDSAVSATPLVLAVWPDADACQSSAPGDDGDGLGVTVDDELLGVTGQGVIDSLAWPKATAIKWMDGTSSTITLDIESTGDGCFKVSPLPIELEGGSGVTYPVTLKLASADGRLDGEYPGEVTVKGGADGQRLSASVALQLAVADVAKSGFASVKVPSGSDSLLLEVDSRRHAGSASGSVHLFAISSPPCATTPPPAMSTPSSGANAAAPGCAGQSETQLETASWGD